MQVGLLTKQFRWIITNLDAHSLDLDQFKYGGTNITTFRILDTNHPIFYTGKVRKESLDDRENFDKILEDSSFPNLDPQLDEFMPVYPDKFIGKFISSSALAQCVIQRFSGTIGLQNSLIYDAVMVYAMAIQQLGADQMATNPIYCDDSSSTWNKGYTIINFMKNVSRSEKHK